MGHDMMLQDHAFL